jgi:ribonuclease HI
VAIAATLSQIQGKREVAISYYSRSLTENEKKWHSNELELAAIVNAISHYREYLIGRAFLVYTDNIACVSLLKKPTMSPRLHRWALMVQDYRFSIKHKSGRTNVVADALSQVETCRLVSALGADGIQACQQEDPACHKLLSYLIGGTIDDSLTAAEKKYILKEKERFEVIKGTLLRLQHQGPPW